jgi:hypothetical protein
MRQTARLIVDDRFRFRPAGTEAGINSGFLSQDSSLALTHLERVR